MLLKHRFPLFFSFLFSLLLAIVMLTVYVLFSNFRKDEFRNRLAEKAKTTVKLLLEVKEVDMQLLRIIDTNSINRFYNEKTIIFDDSLQIIYSSLDDATINWTKQELLELKKKQEVFRKNGSYDVFGIYYEFDGRDYYVMVSAEDNAGVRTLSYLKLILIGASIIGTVAVWLIAFLLSKRTLKPLDKLRRQMQDITSKNLAVRVREPRQEDEIKALSQSFNQMLDRIDRAYKSQKEFTSNASHELRTPIARIVMQLENLTVNERISPHDQMILKSVSDDAYQLSDIVTSLLVLSKTEESGEIAGLQKVRLDEIIFQGASQLSGIYPDFKLHFEIEVQEDKDLTMELQGDETLLKIAILNLFKNAYLYSDDQIVRCCVGEHDGLLRLTITNRGEVPNTTDTTKLFNTFTRGSNSGKAQGSGIGLSIVRRILHYHHGTVTYDIVDNTTNKVSVLFPALKV